MLIAAPKIELVLRGIWNAVKSIPVAVWHTHPRYIHGAYHTSYSVTWVVIVIIVILAIVSFLRSR